MTHSLFPRWHWNDAERRVCRFMPPDTPDANRPPPTERADRPREAGQPNPETAEPPLDAATVRQRDQLNRRADAARRSVEQGLNKIRGYLQGVANGVFNVEKGNFERNVRAEATRNSITGQEQFREFYAGKLAEFHAYVVQPIMMRLQTDQAVRAPNSPIPPFHLEPGSGNTLPRVVLDAPGATPANGPANGPAAGPGANPDQGRYVDGIRTDVNAAATRLRGSKDIFEAMGHLAEMIGKGMEGLMRAMDGSLMRQTPETQARQQRRARLITEARAVPGDAPFVRKLDALQQNKRVQLQAAEAAKLPLEQALPGLRQAKTVADAAVAALPPGPSPQRTALETAATAATAALTGAEQNLTTVNQQLQNLGADNTEIDAMKVDLANMQTAIDTLLRQAIGPDFATAFGAFTVTPDGLVPTPTTPPSRLQQAFPRANADRPVTLQQLRAFAASRPAAASGAPPAGPALRPAATPRPAGAPPDAAAEQNRFKEAVAGDVVQMILNYTAGTPSGPQLPNRNHFTVSDDGSSITVNTPDAGSMFLTRLGLRQGQTITIAALANQLSQPVPATRTRPASA